MEAFTYKSCIGDFLDVLSLDSPLSSHEDSVCVSRFGATADQRAILSRYFGNLALGQTQDFAFSLHALLSQTIRLVALDFSLLKAICPNAVAALVNFAAEVEGRGKQLVLFRPAPALTHALENLGITYLFTILHTEEELILALPD